MGGESGLVGFHSGLLDGLVGGHKRRVNDRLYVIGG